MPARASVSVSFDLTPFLLVPATGGDPPLYPDWLAGLRAGAPLSFAVENAATLLYRVLLPANADYDFGSDPGNEGFSYTGFPGLAALITGGDPVPLVDPNGLPVTFGKLYLAAARVRRINPGEDAGGTVTITASNDFCPGDQFGCTGVDDDIVLSLAKATGWEPGSTGTIDIRWDVTTAATIADINLFVELVLLGDPPPAP